MTSHLVRPLGSLWLAAAVLLPLGCGGDGTSTDDASTDTATVCVATASQEQSCVGGVDEDCDTFVDCQDVDCASSPSCQAACVPVTEGSQATCSNGVDDDCGGLTDCADPGCIQPGVFSCLGSAWSSRCVSPLTGSQTMTTTGVELLLTSSGVSGTAGHSSSGVTLDIVTVGASASATAVDLVAPPNDDRDSCTHCFVLHRGGKDFYVRRANVVLSELPSEVGQPFAATLTGSFEEVTSGGNHVTPVSGGECLVLEWTITGTAVSSTQSLGLAGSGAAVTAALQGRMGHTAAPTTCDGNETLGNSPFDCACSNAAQMACPGGHSCPAGSVCLTQGRCECLDTMLGLDCATGAACGTDGACSAGSAWSCVRMGCGIQNYTVSCGNGFSCPTNSTCAGDVCLCDPGHEYVPCAPDDARPELGRCMRRLIPACSTQYDPASTSCSPGEEGGNYCGANSVCAGSGCTCNPGYVAASCDGIRCSDENPCELGGISHGCFPDAQVP